jgi:iron complex outermembrane receptor protein
VTEAFFISNGVVMLRSKETLLSLVFACSFGSPVFAQSQVPAPAAGEMGGGEEIEEIVVKTTRSGRRVQDEPIRVDVLNQEEIEEKVMMRPGNIVMMLAETGGLRVQTTSPALGAANIRVQGLSGRYTQVLTDGLPLYGGQAISLLQIPPTDLGQVEVIKGAASALYGPSALGGVVNLISRRPGADPVYEVVLNATSRNGQDATTFTSMPLDEEWAYSLIGGVHRQQVHDLDDDGWSDIPGYERWTVRPRLFWTGAQGANVFFTAGAMGEQREGGALEGRTMPDGASFPQTQKSHRFDGGIVAEIPVSVGALHLRASGMTQDHSHRFGAVLEDDRHDTLFGEVSFAARSDGTSWLAGLAAQRDAYRSGTFSQFDYTYTTPGVFAQVEHDLSEVVTLAGSARWDDHNVYGRHFSPRLSMLYRPGPWTVRASVGRGFYAPTPFVDEIDDAGLSRLQPLNGIKAETASTASLEGGYSQGALETNLTLFASRIKNAVRLEDLPAPAQGVQLINVSGSTNTLGAEFLARYRWEEVIVTASYVFVHAREPELAGGRRTVPLTPRHTGGVVAMWEREDAGRLGLEVYYTGKQSLENNPYRAIGRPYVEIGLLGEVVLGKVRLFLNLENLLNVRQTKYDPMVRPSRAADGRSAVDAWGPTDGFVVNGGIRLRFGES